MNISQWSLSNGIRIYTIHHPLSPVVHFSWNVHVGAAYESTPGIAHLCEHLMFTGTPSYKDYDAYLVQIGASNNAWTSYDTTSFDIESTPEHLQKIIALEADRILHLADNLCDEQFQKERNIVCNEYNEGLEEEPLNLFFHKQHAAIFGASHPYGHPIIGNICDIQKIKRDDCIQFIKQYYCANNISLCISSSCSREVIQEQLQKYWTAIPQRKDLHIPSIPFCSVQTPIFKTTIKKAPAFFSFDWLFHKEHLIVARCLSIILNSAQYGVLYHTLELEREYVCDLEIEVEERKGICIFNIQGLLTKESYREHVRQICLKSLYDIAQGEIPSFLITKTAKKLKLLWLLSLETQLGKHETINSWIQKENPVQMLEDFIESHQKISLQELCEFASFLHRTPYCDGQNYET